jgi:hypothetical protein
VLNVIRRIGQTGRMPDVPFADIPGQRFNVGLQPFLQLLNGKGIVPRFFTHDLQPQRTTIQQAGFITP